jgi:hypothetical protein
MNFVAPMIGIIMAFGWSIFLLNSQLKEIRSLKAQLAIERDYSKDLENDLSTCKADVDFLKNGVEDMMKVCRPR